MRPTNNIPKVGNSFYVMNDDSEVLTIVEIENEIEDDIYVGCTVVCDDGVSYDCFWSDKNQRFQYFTDANFYEE